MPVTFIFPKKTVIYQTTMSWLEFNYTQLCINCSEIIDQRAVAVALY